MIRAVLIDDEEISLKGLGEKIKKYCPDVSVLKSYSKPVEALKEIQELRPDVVFLDIEMPKMNGFAFLKNCSPVPFEVIFTTAYNVYAIDALRISALDFLLKPIDADELVAATSRLKDKLKHKDRKKETLEQQIETFLQSQQSSGQLDKIAVPVLNGLEFVDADEIIRIEGEDAYSVFYLTGNKKIVASRNLNKVEKMLTRKNFMRVHKSYIVNLNYIRQYIKGNGGRVILSDGSEVEVSRRNKSEFLTRVNYF
ncbi:DNA-binding response regulator [Cytophagales bacterium WSM2-2]|nr:DNA-binding response regulator [Cytophagales bacterium WSM2-2]